MMKKIFFSILILIIYLLNSCCDCNVNPVNNPIANCLIREANITEFNADLIKINDTLYKPSSYYSVHSFLFPQDKNLSGTLVNDERFARTGEIVVATQTMSNNSSYKIAILDNNPINSLMIGDILVDTVFSINSTANLKFTGQLARLDSNFIYDDAQLFCDYINFNQNYILNQISNLSLYGENLLNSSVAKTFTSNDIRILNELNENVTGKTGVPQPINTDINKLLNSVNSNNISVNVKAGDVYLYRTIYKNLFVVLITNISNGSLPPNKGKVSIMFNRIN